MIVPLLRNTIRGAIWYQGESDCMPGYDVNYACTFPAMIADWRARWHAASRTTSPQFPFGFVQLSTWDNNNETQVGSVPVVRWGQTANFGYVPNQALPNTFMATAVDLGDPASPVNEIHPRYKREVGERLGQAALAVVYGSNTTYWHGPVAGAVERVGGAALRVSFRNAGAAGLVARHTDGFDGLVGAGEGQGQWAPCAVQDARADAVTLGACTLAGSDVTSLVTTVRYIWRQAPCHPFLGPGNCPIYAAAEGLPALPFIMNVTRAA